MVEIAEDWQFLLGYTMLIFIITQISPSVFLSTAFGSEIVPPVCEIGGWDAVIDAIVCGLGNIGFFFSLASISTEFALIETILITPLIVTLVWIIIKMIRGSS